MGRRTEDDAYTDEEAERRMIEALRRALNTPHKPHQPKKRKPKRAASAGRRHSAASAAKTRPDR